MTQLPFTIEVDPASSVLTISGDVDEQPAMDLRRMLEEQSLDYTRAIVLDLSAVTYLPSAAVAVLLRASQKFAESGSVLELAASSGSVAQRVLTVCAIPHRSY